MADLQHIKLVLAYEGTRYVGWQSQTNGPSIQDALEAAHERLTGHRLRIQVAGRTDAGVHALGQVAFLPNVKGLEPAVFRLGINSLLPDDIVVQEVLPVAADFDVRGDVVGKRYRYLIHNHPVRPLCDRLFRWHLRKPLDLDAMRRACACLLGTHDFACFQASGCQSLHSNRTIDRLTWHFDPPTMILEIWGRAFLKQMVRIIAGTCVEIGRGRMAAQQMEVILAGKDRRQAGPTAPARGLFLVKVYYEEEEYRREVEQPGQSD